MSDIFLDRVADLTECPICRDSMKDPRILHCVHTFCCECLVKYAKSLGPGDRLPCPVCRADFSVPDRGLVGLPKNFIVEKLCEADSEWRKNGSFNQCQKHRDQYLDGFCTECETAVCAACRKADHSGHGECSIDDFYADFRRDVDGDLTRLDHIRSEVDRQSIAVSVTRDNFVDAIEKLKEETVRRGEDIKNLIDKQVELVNEDLEAKLCEFLKECDSVSGVLQLQRTQLESFKSYVAEVLQKAKPCDLACCNARDIRTRSTELLGTMVAGLEARFEVTLQSLDADLLEDSTYNLLGQVDFRRIELDPPNRSLDFEKPASRIGTISCENGEEVVGLTVVRGELYVALANSPDIRVYDALTFEYQSKFLVETLAHPSDLAATKTDLFVFDNRNLTVHKVELDTKFSVTWSIQLKNRFGAGPACYGLGSPCSYFTTGGSGYARGVCGLSVTGSSYPFATSPVAQDFSQVALSFAFYKSVSKGFSLTHKGTVLLISPSNFQREIIEFSGDGRVLREISLCFFVHEPRHVTLLDNDQFLICYGSSNYIGVTKDQMCLVDNQGRLVKRWTKNSQNPPEREICNVTHFAVDDKGNSFVCDYVGGNVHLFDSSLNFVKKIVSEADGLGNPARVFLERPRGRLFVSDSANKSIAIFQLF